MLCFKVPLSEEMEHDWRDFRANQQIDSAERILFAIETKVFHAVVVGRIAMEVALGFTWNELLFRSTATYLVALRVLTHFGAPFVRRSLKRCPQVTGITFQVCFLISMLTVCLCFAFSMDTELEQHRIFHTAQSTYVWTFHSLSVLPLWVNVFIVSPINIIHWMVFHRSIGFWRPQTVFYGIMQAYYPTIVSAWLERIHWQKFQSTQELYRERQHLQAVQATLRQEKETSESMCQELAAEKAASEILLTKLKAEKQALEALLGMVCDGAFWLSSDGDTVVRSEKRIDAIMGCEMLNDSLRRHLLPSEHGRLTNTIQTEVEGTESPVKLLTTTIQHDSNSIHMDLFIVDRRCSFFDTSSDLGFLVGVRLCQNSEPLCQNSEPENSSEVSISLHSASYASSLVHEEAYPLLKSVKQQSRKRVRQPSESCFGTSQLSDFSGDWETNSESLPAMRRDPLPLREPFQACTGVYHKDCVKSTLEDLCATFNFQAVGCCHWHAYVNMLQSWIRELHGSECKAASEIPGDRKSVV